MRKPKFRDPKTLTKKQLTDPDYAKKAIAFMAKRGKFRLDPNCSMCHHCR